MREEFEEVECPPELTNAQVYAQYVRNLRRQNDVLATLCGIRRTQYVIDNAVRIQASVRGWILRTDKRIFDKCVHTFLRACRTVIQRRRFARYRASCVRVQSVFRGRRVRRATPGRAVQRVLAATRDVSELEMRLLKGNKYRVLARVAGILPKTP